MAAAVAAPLAVIAIAAHAKDPLPDPGTQISSHKTKRGHLKWPRFFIYERMHGLAHKFRASLEPD